MGIALRRQTGSLSSRMTKTFCNLRMGMIYKSAGAGQPDRMLDDMLDDMLGN